VGRRTGHAVRAVDVGRWWHDELMVERLKVCLNGRRGREEHPAVPITAAELAVSAAAAVAAGAEAVHLHARGADGTESLRAEDVTADVAAVRAACPGVPVGVSTGLWICDGDAALRRSMVDGWAAIPAPQRPDFASANVGESGFAELVAALHDAGIAVEAGVWSAADAETLAASGTGGWVRILVEVIGEPAERAVAVADEILARLDALDIDGPRLLHGEEATCWPLVAHAGRLGLATRIGLEDTTVGPDAGPVAGNAELVRLALVRWKDGL
jgi:uncharacterized protein (DUF849 family)